MPSDVDELTSLSALSKPKIVACRKCHAKKVKCLGGRPCQSCVQLKCESECVYPRRDRQIKISQSYIERILKENQSLKARLEQAGQSRTTFESDHQRSTEHGSSAEEPSKNPLLDERPWFLPITSSKIPIFIGELADPAFATRFRQIISKDPLNHIPRTNYPNSDQIMVLMDSGLPKLSHTHARFLLRTALSYLEGHYHIVRKSAASVLLDRYMHEPALLALLSRCKIHALFALGELFSSRYGSSTKEAPGLSFFSYATKAYGLLYERPSIDCIEVCLLLSLYSLSINRRHSAYFLASSAVRHCLVSGLHFNLSDSQFTDSGTREHLSRLWWSSYLLDRMNAMISSQVPSVSDDENFADLPSDAKLSPFDREDFSNTDYLASKVSLARLISKIARRIYSRNAHNEPFLRRVQSSLIELERWNHDLPESLQVRSQSTPPKPEVISLNLFFNQSLIMATRPILLHVLRLQKKAAQEGFQENHFHSDNTKALAEVCIQCARHSYTMVTDSWIAGTFYTYDYFNTQYLFSATTILAIASLINNLTAQKDREMFEFAGQLMRKLRDAGSYPATEFCRHLDGIEADIRNLEQVDQTSQVANDEQQGENQPEAPCFTPSGMIFTDPSICSFLSQNEFSPEQPGDFLDNLTLEGIYWPTPDAAV
ncbi:fungal-specific transcription factor domain-containing protein [Annulohypoxylon nitens]|nr:fungal-specific transcription factor domain-containing protein [Annulohypoxylon nitens]